MIWHTNWGVKQTISAANFTIYLVILLNEFYNCQGMEVSSSFYFDWLQFKDQIFNMKSDLHTQHGTAEFNSNDSTWDIYRVKRRRIFNHFNQCIQCCQSLPNNRMRETTFI